MDRHYKSKNYVLTLFFIENLIFYRVRELNFVHISLEICLNIMPIKAVLIKINNSFKIQNVFSFNDVII